MSEAKVIRLTRDPAWLAYRRRLEDLDLLAMELPEAFEQEMMMLCGGPNKVVRSYLKFLFENGWRGLENVPLDCVVD
jgi:hypothetical protein